MSYSLFPRKEGDSMVTTIELNVLYCMVNNIKLDVTDLVPLEPLDRKRARSILKKLTPGQDEILQWVNWH